MGYPSGLPSEFFLVYINVLPNGLLSSPKLFTDYRSIFSVVKDRLNSLNKLNEDLTKIYQKAYQWKMLLNPEFPNKLKKLVILV